MTTPTFADTYSFQDISGSFNHPVLGSFTFSGDLGVGSISFEKTVTRTVMETSADGRVVISAVPGRQGVIHIEVQQTSDVHGFLQNWANYLDQAQYNGDVSNWATATLTFTSQVDGSTHNCYGIAMQKDPTKVYQGVAQHLTWELLAAVIISTSSSSLINQS